MGKPFQDFIDNTSKKFAKRMMDYMDRGTDLILHDQTTQQEKDFLQEYDELTKDLGPNSTQAATDEMQDRAIEHYVSRGMSREEAKKLCESRIKEIVDKAKALREATPGFLDAGRLIWLKVVGVVAGVALIGLAIISGLNAGNSISQHVSDSHNQFEAGTLSMQITANQQEFEDLMRGLKLDLPSVPTLQPEAVTQAPAATAQPAPLPITVAAIAHTPVTATIIQPNVAPQTIQTDVGTVYRLVPAARQQIESRVVEGPQRELHGKIDVTAPWSGGPRVKLNW
jgi:hypothetical protein